MKSHEAIDIIVTGLNDELVIAANGFLSRQLFSIRDRPQNFYMLGSMGLASSIGLGLSLSAPHRKVIIVDGDGNLLMNLGSLATIGHFSPNNLVHIVLDNEVYESTGGQPTVSSTARLEEVARAAGYKIVKKVSDANALRHVLAGSSGSEGSVFILIKIQKGQEKNSRVLIAPEDIKKRFASAIKGMHIT